MGLEQFRRLDEGRLQMIENSRENNIDLAKYEIRQTIIEKFNKQKEIESWFLKNFISKNSSGITGLYNGTEDSNPYVETEENILRYLYKDPKTEETLWRNIPVVIEQLAQHLIEEDLKAFEVYNCLEYFEIFVFDKHRLKNFKTIHNNVFFYKIFLSIKKFF